MLFSTFLIRIPKDNYLEIMDLVSIKIPENYNHPLVFESLGRTLSIEPVSAKSSKAVKEGKNIIKYIEAYSGVDVKQEKMEHKLKESLILKGPNHPEKFIYKINLEEYDLEKDKEGNINFYPKGEKNSLKKIFTIPAPFMIDKRGERSPAKEVEVSLKDNGYLVLTPNPDWLRSHQYPIILDPTIEINILNLHSHPQKGENWEVSFTTLGKSDLRIVPDDEDTIKDDQFVSLSCGNEIRKPRILKDDVIYYPDWSCDEIAKVVHYTLKPGNHTLRFEFNNQTAFAYNSAWLSGWENRVKITIDKDQIDEDLTHFPVPIFISSSSGQNNDDTTRIFDEVGANWQKIAVTKSDGVSQIYVEKEKWSTTTEEAVLWVSTSTFSISSSTDTDIYLYYENSQSDNSDYVAAVNSRPEVWDDYFKAVYHLSESGRATDSRKDSTSNNNHLDNTQYHCEYDGDEDTTDGKIGNADFLDGDDYPDADCASNDSPSGLPSGDVIKTISAWLKSKSDGGQYDDMVGGFGDTEEGEAFYTGRFSSSWKVMGWSSDWNTGYDGNNFLDATWHYVTVTYDQNRTILYRDYNSVATTTNFSWNTDPQHIVMGNEIDKAGMPFQGTLDEFRISSTNRSDAWIKADYQAAEDNLLTFTFNQEPNPPCYPSPPDGAVISSQSTTTLSVYVEDPDGDTLTVNFYVDEATTCSATSSSGSRPSCQKGVSPGSSYSWYVTATDGGTLTATSTTWSFRVATSSAKAIKFNKIKMKGIKIDQ